jgi:hypothetical protein
MFFNLLKKENDKPENNNNILASVTYVVLENSDSPLVDVEMSDYSDKSIQGLCQILDVLASDKSLIETVEIIKNAMISDGQGENLIKIFNHINKNTKSKMIESYKERDEDSPCIKPSEVFIK